MQLYVLAVTLFLMSVVALVFMRSVATSGSRADTADAKSLEPWRKWLFGGLVLVGFVVTAGTLRSWPHDVSASGESISVSATASQWNWELSKTELLANQPVVFNVSSSDVTHGFGVYSPTGRILFQTQGMPGYVNQVRYTFAEPGTYQILCMEYCGLAHHEMKSEFKVVAK